MFEDTNVWFLIALIVFFAAVGRLLWRQITRMLDGRRDSIKSQLEEAKRLREEAQAMLADYERRLQDADQEAENIRKGAREQAQQLRAAAERDLEESIARQERMASEKIAQAEASAIQEVRDRAVSIAVSAAQLAIQENLSQGDDRKIIDQAIQDLPQRLH
jgi:F-type H+-transporting ATPase subunit b